MKSIISISSLSYRNATGGRSLTDIAFDIPYRSLTVISGRNGAGKTLLALGLCGHLPQLECRGAINDSVLAHHIEQFPLWGGIEHSGTDIKNYTDTVPHKPRGAQRRNKKRRQDNVAPSTEATHLHHDGGTVPCLTPHQLSRWCAMVFQHAEYQIVGQTVADDINFGLQRINISSTERHRRFDMAINILQLAELLPRAPLTLSGGELRRVAIASMVVLNPLVLFLDEPFVNLDWEGTQQMKQLINHLLREGITVVIISHQLEHIIADAQYVLLLDNGLLYNSGTPATVLNSAKQLKLLSPTFELAMNVR